MNGTLTVNPPQQLSLLDQFLAKVKGFDPYPILYSRTSTGAVQTWKVEVQGNKYRFITGQKNSPNLVTSNWTVCQGKNIGRANETTPEQQASKEAHSAMALKLKSEGYWENEADIDKIRFFAPMLAHKYVEFDKDGNIKSKRKIDWSKGVYISYKMDGLRCVINREGCFSRKGNRFRSFPHIFRELKPLFDANPDLVLDGEIYTHALKADFDKLISLAKQQKPTQQELAESEEKLEYWIFDVPSVKAPCDERFAWLEKNINQPFQNNKWINVIDHVLVFSEDKVEEILNIAVELGYEGVMMNLPDKTYESDKRSYFILKYKLFIDAEFEIVDILEGVGNRSGMFGRAILKLPDGRTFRAGARGNEKFYIRLLKERIILIGKKATLRFKKYTPDGIPAHGSIIAIRDYE